MQEVLWQRSARRNLMGTLLVAALLGAALPAVAVERAIARAYVRGGDALLYTETHLRYRDAGVDRHLVVYRCPDGAAFARKTVVAQPSATAPDFEFVDGRSGYREGVRTRDGKREVFVQAARTGAEQVKPLPARAGGIIDAGFDAGVRQHWRALGNHDMRLAFLIPERFDYVPLKLAAVGDASDDGRDVRRLQMTLDRWFGFAVPPIDLTYAVADQRLLEFAGPGMIRDDRGRSREVRIVFPQTASVAGAQVSQDAIRREAALPLDGRCSV